MQAVSIRIHLVLLTAAFVTAPLSSYAQSQSVASRASAATPKTAGSSNSSAEEEFNTLRLKGNEAVYNLEYQAAREMFERMTKLVPDHPAGYVYLANNFWLELLNANRRLSSSLYSGGSFYEQDAEQDAIDPVRERQFNDLTRKALAVALARIRKDPRDVEALYYQGAVLGLKASFNVTVKRSFRRAIGDANESISIQRKVIKLDPNYVDAYLSIGLYDYIVDSLPWVWKTLARLAGVSGSKKRGIERLEMVTKSGKFTSDDARVVLIGIYTREAQPERALEIITHLATKYPSNYLLGVERAGMLFRMNRTAEGDQAFADLVKDNRISQVAPDLVNWQWGQALREKGNYAKALERYNEVIAWKKSDQSLVTLAHLNSGLALDALGKREQAVAKYQEVLKRENVYDSRKVAGQHVNKPYVPAGS
ncbi:MAG TPA: tetratricopeptide repeat protein [Blastocatellia bacterium]|nr:tetratricopeptide repeat protein [Blastocatellia bacterium]